MNKGQNGLYEPLTETTLLIPPDNVYVSHQRNEEFLDQEPLVEMGPTTTTIVLSKIARCVRSDRWMKAAVTFNYILDLCILLLAFLLLNGSFHQMAGVGTFRLGHKGKFLSLVTNHTKDQRIYYRYNYNIFTQCSSCSIALLTRNAFANV